MDFANRPQALDPIEEIGLSIIALARTGFLDEFDCSSCDEELRKFRNCSLQVGIENNVYYHERVGQLQACPLRCIPQSVLSFLDEFDYYEKYPSSAPNYDSVNPRYWLSVKYLEGALASLRKTEEPANNSGNESDKMAKFRALAKG